MTESARSRLGLVEGTLAKLLVRSATVSEAELLAGRFRLVRIEGPALRGVRWEPGQKVQVMLGAFTQRTYTPLSWDAVAGSAQLLAYVHGEGPGAEWARSLRVGDSCRLFGPRDSIDLDVLRAPGLLFGDETSIGLAYALHASKSGGHGIEILLEVSEADRVRAVLQRLGLEATLVQKRMDDAHIVELQDAITQAVQLRSVGTAVLSGKAITLRILGKHARSLGLRKIVTRAYWAPGKKGLD